MKSQVLSLRLKPDQMERLRKLARRADRKPSELAAKLIEEALRMAEFPHIEFRDTIIGRQVYVKGHRVAIWMLAWIARDYDHDPARTAEHFQWPTYLVEDGLRYYRTFAHEIDPLIADHEASDLEQLRQTLPNIQVFTMALDGGALEPLEVGIDAQAVAR